MNGPKTAVAVIGAGISGLALAYRLKELFKERGRPLRLRLFESAARAGGSIATASRGGFLLEKGPDSFLSEKPHAIRLCARLGLEGQIINTNEPHRRTFVVQGRRLHPLPDGFYLIAPRNPVPFLATGLFSPLGKVRMLAEYLVPADRTVRDESVAAFIRRRFGAEALERVGQPMIAGVYSGDPERLSILSTMPRFRQMESEHGSVIRALRKRTQPASGGPRYSLFLSLKQGLQAMTDALQAQLAPDTLFLGARVESVSYDPAARVWRMRVDGREESADALCLAVPAQGASVLLKTAAPSLSRTLSEMRCEFVATLNLAYDAKRIRHPLDGFGFVVPRTQKRSLMACTFVHRKFPGRAPAGRVLLRAFIGGAFGRDVFARDDGALADMVKRDLSDLLGIEGEPELAELSRYPDALPQYRVGHGAWLERVEAETAGHPGLFLTGASYRGTGIPDCVCDAERTAEKVAEGSF